MFLNKFGLVVALLFVFIILFAGTFILYTTKNNDTQYIANQYDSMVTYLVKECNIDLNELQKKTIEEQRCNSLRTLYEKNAIDYNTLIKYSCGTTLSAL